jgi:hypothetical protein
MKKFLALGCMVSSVVVTSVSGLIPQALLVGLIFFTGSEILPFFLGLGGIFAQYIFGFVIKAGLTLPDVLLGL